MSFLHPTHNKDYRMVQAEVAVGENFATKILAAAEKGFQIMGDNNRSSDRNGPRWL